MNDIGVLIRLKCNQKDVSVKIYNFYILYICNADSHKPIAILDGIFPPAPDCRIEAGGYSCTLYHSVIIEILSSRLSDIFHELFHSFIEFCGLPLSYDSPFSHLIIDTA